MLNLQETSTTIKASELRFGNLIKYYDELVEVYGVKGLYVIIAVEENGEVKEQSILAPAFEPIPLTPEILEKCGFVKSKSDKDDNEDHYVYGNQVANNFSLYFDTDHWEIAQEWNDSRVYFYFWNHINHLHQLQNLYFALTGEELKINL